VTVFYLYLRGCGCGLISFPTYLFFANSITFFVQYCMSMGAVLVSESDMLFTQFHSVIVSAVQSMSDAFYSIPKPPSKADNERKMSSNKAHSLNCAFFLQLTPEKLYPDFMLPIPYTGTTNAGCLAINSSTIEACYKTSFNFARTSTIWLQEHTKLRLLSTLISPEGSLTAS